MNTASPSVTRTTVTLDPDVLALLKKAMRERDVSFKQALNDAVRRAAAASAAAAPKPLTPPRWKTYAMGQPLVDLTKANQLIGELEDRDFIEKMQRQAGARAADPRTRKRP